MDFVKGLSNKVKDVVSEKTTETLSPEKIADGLREALDIGTKKAVELCSAKGGFLANDAIKITMPEDFEAMASIISKSPLSGQLDDFIATMNHAAEKAAEVAYEVFAAALKGMTIDKALELLNGAVTAATCYFDNATRALLHGKFYPIVVAVMKEIGVLTAFEALTEAASKKLPFFTKPELNLEEHVTTKALDGLFHVLGEKEKEIRTVPAMRVTPLLQEVFSKANAKE